MFPISAGINKTIINSVYKLRGNWVLIIGQQEMELTVINYFPSFSFPNTLMFNNTQFLSLSVVQCLWQTGAAVAKAHVFCGP